MLIEHRHTTSLRKDLDETFPKATPLSWRVSLPEKLHAPLVAVRIVSHLICTDVNVLAEATSGLLAKHRPDQAKSLTKHSIQALTDSGQGSGRWAGFKHSSITGDHRKLDQIL